jgi:hydrogenase maturation protease
VSLAETVELARVLGRLPARTVVYGIEGGSFAIGEPLTPAVAAAAVAVADAIREEVATSAG